MIGRIIKSFAFGGTFTIAMLIFRGFKAAGSLPIWSEICISFLIASTVDFLVTIVFDWLMKRRKKGSHKE